MSSPAFYSEGPRSPYEHGSGQAEHVQNVVSDIPTHLMRGKLICAFCITLDWTGDDFSFLGNSQGLVYL